MNLMFHPDINNHHLNLKEMNRTVFMPFALMLIIFCTYLINPVSAQWKWINPLPTGHDYNDLAFINDSTGWIIGEKGTIMKTTDAGKTFTMQHTGRDVELWGISFLNSATGYIIGDSSTLFKTTDGGDTWTELNTPLTDVNPGYGSVFFLSELEGWVTTTWSGILSTDDGGLTWSIYNDFWEWDWVGPVYFTSSLIGYRSGRFLFKTTDGGDSWSEIYASGNGLPFASEYGDIFFINDTVGWVHCFLPNISHIARTLDGGTTWSVVFSGPAAGSFYFINVDTGWCINQYGIQKTTDGGQSWETCPLGCKNLVMTENTGYAVGNGGIIARQNLHDNLWTRLDKNFLDNEKINDIFFNDPQLGFIAADSGKILRTTDGGNSWEMTKISDSEADNLFFTDAASGWLSDRNSIFHTADSGKTWVKNYDRAELKDIFFINADTGWAAGWYYGMLFTGDGGITWTNQELLDGYYFDFVYFKDNRTGWAAGPTGMRKTTNGGASWMQITKPAEENIYDIKFFNSGIGWLVGSYGLIMKTEDGGETWNEQHHTPDVYNAFKKIKILDSMHVWVTGDFEGLLYVTDDGGATWSEKTCMANQFFNALSLLDRNKGFLGGLNGVLLEYTGDYGIPAYPSDLVAAPCAPGSVVLSWTDNADNENGFEILRSDRLSVNYQRIGYAGADITEFTDAGIDLSCDHWYRVRAYNEEGFSATTREVCARSMVPSVQPVLIIPADGSECNIGNVLFSWSSVPDATGYYLQVAIDSNFNYLSAEQQDISDTLVRISTLYNYNNYYWRVTASNAYGHGIWSETGYFSLAVVSPAIPALGSPLNEATDQPLSVVFSWYPVQNADSYHLKVFPPDDVTSPVFDQAGITDTSILVSGLSENTSYAWMVNATNIAGTSEWSLVNDFRYFTTGTSTFSEAYKDRCGNYINAYPNPFSGKINIAYSIEASCKVELSVYNLAGKLIIVLVKVEMGAGKHILEWDGSDQNNRQVPDGVYIYKLQAGKIMMTGMFGRTGK